MGIPLLRLTRPGWVLPGAVIDLDFVNHRAFGGGPLVTTRASQGFAPYTLLGNNNILATFAAGLPRITDRGVLCELAATNLALRSRDFANAAWVATNVTVAQTSVGADSTANGAARLTAGAVNATLLQIITGSAVARTVSFWIKRVTGSGTVGLCQDGVTFTDISGQLSTTAFTLVSLTATQLNPSIGLRLGTSGDAIDVDFAQLETGAVPTSPIVTTSATAARAADALSVSALPVQQFGTLFVQATTPGDASATDVFAMISDGSNVNYITLRRASTTTLQGRSVIASAAVNASLGTWANSARSKAAMAWSGGSQRGSVNGAAIVSGSPGTFAADMTKLSIGADGLGATQCRGYVERIALWTAKLTDAQLQAVTA